MIAAPGAWLNAMPHLDPRFGGIASTVPPLCSALARAGQPVSIAAFCERDERNTAIDQRMGLQIYPFGRAQLWHGSHFRSLLDNQISQSCGLHIHGLWSAHCAMAADFAKKWRKPYIVSAHGMLDSWAVRNKGWKKKLYSLLVQNSRLRDARCLHALTLSEAEDYRRAGFRNPIAVVPNGIDLQPDGNPEMFLTHYPELRGRRITLFLGRVHHKKGLDLLCRAWPGTCSRFSNAHLVIAGPDSEGTESRIAELAEKMHIANRITFTGMISGAFKRSALAAAECFVLPSYSEGFSVSVLEALGAGKPVIVTRQCNIPEVSEHGCGWVIEPWAAELEAALDSAYRLDAAARGVKGESGRQLVRSRFNWSLTGMQMSEVYRWVLGGPKPESARIVL